MLLRMTLIGCLLVGTVAGAAWFALPAKPAADAPIVNRSIGNSKPVESKSDDWRAWRLSDVPRYVSPAATATAGESFDAGFVTLCQYAAPLQPTLRHPPGHVVPGHGHGQRPIYTQPFGELASIPTHAFTRDGFVSPPRLPFSPEYRVRVGDQLQFLYQVSREASGTPYRLSVGDVISIESDSHEELKRENIEIIRDGTISFPPLQSFYVLGLTLAELKQRLEEELTGTGLREPRVTVIPVKTDLPNLDLRDVVDGRQGLGGQRLDVTVQWDGAVWLPMINGVPIVGLTLSEVADEVNARYDMVVDGIHLTPVLVAPAPAFVYVLGEVRNQGRVEIQRPTSPLQVITQAGGQLEGANMHSVMILRRTPDWRLVATRLDLNEAAFGRGLPKCNLWLYDGDIVIVPRLPIERFAELIELYLTRGLYALIPTQGISINFAQGSLL